MGQRGRRGLRTRIRAEHPRTGRQQRRDRASVRGSRPRAARDRLRGRGHRRPALHDDAPAVHPRATSTTTLVSRLQAAYASIAVGDPRDAGNAGRSADRRRGVRRAPANARRRDGRRRRGRRRRAPVRRPLAGRVLRPSRAGRNAGAIADDAARDVRADPLRAAPSTTWTRRSRSTTACRAWTVLVHLHAQSARTPRSSCRRAAATAGSPTSTSAPAARKSVALSAAKSRRAAAANPARTRGRVTCAARPARSTSARICRSRRGSASRPGAATDETRAVAVRVAARVLSLVILALAPALTLPYRRRTQSMK